MNNFKSSPDYFHKTSQSDFDIHALELFREQAVSNQIYNQYLKSLLVDPTEITKVNDIPFMPIEFFKWHSIKTNEWQEEMVFESSGTTGMIRSKHYIKDVNSYHQNARNIFEKVFGPIRGKVIIGLLPSYLERGNSSLVNMVNHFIDVSGTQKSGFYLNEYDQLADILSMTEPEDDVVIFAVSFALLDLAEKYKLDLSHITMIETGGMKGRRNEITKEELYEVIRTRLGISTIYSEYGMTELLSQAYGRNGRFNMPESLAIYIRDINDPFTCLENGRTGGINIIDLANRYSCAFIETKDLGRINQDNSFEVLGRFDNSDLRGCNLLIS